MKSRFLAAGVLILGGFIYIGGCAHSRELQLDLSDGVQVPRHRVLVLFADGLRADVTARLVREGRLPNIKKYLCDRGCTVENAVSCIPSITYTAIATMTTGRFPGHHQILGNNWFDPVSGRYQDYLFIRTYQQVDADLRAPTVYELLQDKFTVTIQTANRRGATRSYDNWISSGINWFIDRPLEVDRLVAQRFEEIAGCAAATGRWPDYIFAYFPAADSVGHKRGATSPEYCQAIVNMDQQVGRICRALERNGMLNDYYLILVSDHGHEYAPKENYWSPETYFARTLHLPTIDKMFMENATACERHSHLKKYRVVIVNGGPRQTHIFLRTGPSWMTPPSFEQVQHFLRDFAPATYREMGNRDLLELLPQIPAIGMVTAKVDANTVRVFRGDTVGEVIRKVNRDGTKAYRYTTIKGDPLDYRACPATEGMVNQGFYSGDAWLEASCQSEYPDFVPQIVDMFNSIRAGQITVFGATDWDFSCRDFGGHGSVLRGDMIVPFIVAGPGVRHGSLKTARIADITPTVLDMLGCLDRLNGMAPIDGKSLLPAMTTTRPAQ